MSARVIAAVAAALLAAGASLAAWGLSQLAWPASIPFDAAGLGRFAATAALGWALTAAGSRLSGRGPFVIGAALTAIVAASAGATWALLACFWFAISATVLGARIVQALRVPRSSWLISLLVGAGAYGTLISLVAAFPVHHPAVYALLLMLPLVTGAEPLRRLYRDASAWTHAGADAKGASWLLDVSIVAVAGIHFVVALMPEIGWDALATHLFLPMELARRHRWDFDVEAYTWAVMPALGDWVYSVPCMFAGETAARLANVGFIFALVLLVRDLALWARATPQGVRWIALLLLATPLTFTESSSLLIESVWTCFAIGGTLLLVRGLSCDAENRADLRPAGLLTGYALAAKAVTFTMLPALLLLVAWHHSRVTRGTAAQHARAGLGLFFAVGSIPYLRALWLTGNPVFPFFNAVFLANDYPPENFAPPAAFGTGFQWDTVYRATFDSGRFLDFAMPGAPGFQWLVLMPAVILLVVGLRARRAMALLFVAALTTLICFHQIAYLRYVFPSIALMSAALAVAFGTEGDRGRALHPWLELAATAVVGLNLLFFPAGSTYHIFPLRTAWDERERAAFLERVQPVRTAVALVNRLNDKGAPVAVFARPFVAGLHARPLMPMWYSIGFAERSTDVTSPSAMADLLASYGARFVILDEGRDLDDLWGRDPRQVEAIRSITEEVAAFGPISVRRLGQQYLFRKELLANPGFASASGWSLTPGAEFVPGQGLRVNVETPATQAVPVAAGRHYLLSIDVACAAQPAQARLQINWHDAQSRFIQPSLRAVDCSPAGKHDMEVIAPDGAAVAFVYASGHSATPVIFRAVSFRQ